jgi:hypothetical protein
MPTISLFYGIGIKMFWRGVPDTMYDEIKAHGRWVLA